MKKPTFKPVMRNLKNNRKVEVQAVLCSACGIYVVTEVYGNKETLLISADDLEPW